MPGVPLPEMSPWKPRSLSIPPVSLRGWVRLAAWQLWMGMLVCLVAVLSLLLITTSPSRILAVSDLSGCYGPPPVALPCERIVYRGGMLDAAFTALCGVMLIGVAVWILWELWSASEPKPITDDFLRLLDDSFGRSWLNPIKWPWARMLWSYGFTAVGAIVTAGIGVTIWTLVASRDAGKVPAVRVETSQSYTLAP